MKMRALLLVSRLVWACSVLLGSSGFGQPIVSLELVERDAMETRLDQNAIFWAEFRVLRTEPATSELTVFLNTRQGSARLGEDYWLDGVKEGSIVRIPAGAKSVNVRLYPIDDSFYEGDETVYFHLVASPSGAAPYEIDLAHSSVEMVIHDNDPVTTRLDIISPLKGQQFHPGDPIELRAQVIGPGSTNSWSMEFFDGDHFIGKTRANTPIWWSDASGGTHSINARAIDSQGAKLSSEAPITIQVGPGAKLPVVRIAAAPWQTGEPCPTCRIAPAILIIERTAPTNTGLTVFLEVDGTAIPGDDYEPLPSSVEIPAGHRSVQLTLVARDDQLAEGPEVVRVRLLPQPPPHLPPTYFVNVHAQESLVTISDDEREAPQARLDILTPSTGAHLKFPSIVQLSALAVNVNNEVYGPVDFYAGDRWVARSPVVASTAPPIPGLPSVHTAYWTNPPVGQYVLTARTRLSLDQTLTSPPIKITVESPMLPAVRIETISRISEETSIPFKRLALVGAFRISRTGPVSNSLPVYVTSSGSALSGHDYRPLPFLVTIPEGTNSVFVAVQPVVDDRIEGLETVVATISNCPPFPFDPPCYNFTIDPAHASATVFIRDDGLTEASLAITSPTNGASFKSGETIVINAVAIDLESYISRVEFYDGDHLLGVSELFFLVAPPPGTPIEHSFEWQAATRGAHVLTVRATRATGEIVTSQPVRITVDTVENQAPVVAITHPASGAAIPPNTSIEITVKALDLDGYVRTVEFYADERKIGERSLGNTPPPDPGQPQIFSFLWTTPAPGPHVLTTRAIDDVGGSARSTTIEIRVPLEVLPILAVSATDNFAVEPALTGESNTASFRLRRFGSTNTPLTVVYTMRGTAQNGIDYELLSGSAVIPLGSFTTNIMVRPLADQLAEGLESVILRLEEQPQYHLGFRRRAIAVVSDTKPVLGLDRTLSAWLPDGCFQASFTASNGVAFRVEASSDMLNWETVLTTTAVDGSLNFVEDNAANFPRRFYRLAPEPVPGPND